MATDLGSYTDEQLMAIVQQQPENQSSLSSMSDEDLADIAGVNLNIQKPSFRTEILGPITNAASALAFDIPRTAMKLQIMRGEPGAQQAYDLAYPQQQTGFGKALRFATEAPATLLGGAGKIAGRVAAKTAPLAARGLIGKVGRGALIGGAFEAATAKPTFEEYEKGVKTGLIGGGLIPLAGKAASQVSKATVGTGRFIAENVGGITKATRDVINRLGASRVFEPAKKEADYIGKELVPKAITEINRKIIEFSEPIEDFARKILKAPEKVISDIKNFGVKEVNKTAQKFNYSTAPIYQNIESGFAKKEGIADEAYRKALKSFKGQAIDSTPFFQSIQKGLISKGWIDLQGNPTTRYKGGLDPVTDKLTDLYIDMKNTATSTGKKISGHVLSKEDFSTYRDALGAMIREKPSDILVMDARNSLYNSAEKSGMTGIKEARNLERQIFQMQKLFKNNQDQLKSVAGESALSRIHKIPESQLRQLKILENFTGVNFVDDLRKISASKYVNDISNSLTDPASLESTLSSLKGTSKYNLRDQYKNLIGEKNYDDLLAHFANIDFNLVTSVPGASGGFYPSRSGIIRSGVTEAAKQYYKNIQPKVKGFREVIKPAGESLERYYKSPIGRFRPISGKATIGAALGTSALLAPKEAQASEPAKIDVNKIFQIESSGNPKAHNKSEDARGLGQIRPAALEDYNNAHKNSQVTPDELFDPDINRKVTEWYINVKIPQYLKSFGHADTIENRIVAYNAGIGRVGKGNIPQTTKNYIKKYRTNK